MSAADDTAEALGAGAGLLMEGQHRRALKRLAAASEAVREWSAADDGAWAASADGELASAQLHLLHGMAAACAGRNHEALTSLQEARDLRPQHPLTLLALANCLAALVGAAPNSSQQQLGCC